MDKFVNEVNVQKENYNIEDKFSCKKIKYKNKTESTNQYQIIDLTDFIFGVQFIRVNEQNYYPNDVGEVDIGELATISDITLVNEKIDDINLQLLQKLSEEQSERIQSDKKINVSQSSTDGYITFTNSDGVSIDIWVGSSGSGGGTDYNNLANKPYVNGTQLIGSKNGHDLNLANLSDLDEKQDLLESGVNIKTINNQSLLDFGNLELQNKLESGLNIKTINGESILGSGNINIQGGSGTSNYNNLINKPRINDVELNGNVSSSDLDIPTKQEVNNKQDKLQSGINIKTINHQSIMGSGNINIQGGGGSGEVGIEITRDEYIALRDSGQLLEDTDYYVIDDFSQGYSYIKTINGIGIDENLNVTLKTSDIENDSGYVTENDIPTKVSELENDSNYQTETQVSSSIETSISPIQENITEINSNLDDEILNRENGDTSLQQKISSINESVTSIQSRISEINSLIPLEATEDNQLADKDFVNSSISTNTSNFIGTFNTLEELESQSATNNDYAFWKTLDSDNNVVYKRYKYVSDDGTWQFEYDLNNSSFTSEQWKSINSGITAEILSEIISAVQQTVTIDKVYPVGSIYMSVNDVDPELLFGGKWERLPDRFLLGKGDTYSTLGDEGGASTVTLEGKNIPNHAHGLNGHQHNMEHKHNMYHAHGMNHRHLGDGCSGIASNNTTSAAPSANANTKSVRPAVQLVTAGPISTTSTNAKTTTDYSGTYTGGILHNSTGAAITNTGGNSGDTTAYGGDTNKKTVAHDNMPPYLVVNMWQRYE